MIKAWVVMQAQEQRVTGMSNVESIGMNDRPLSDSDQCYQDQCLHSIESSLHVNNQYTIWHNHHFI